MLDRWKITAALVLLVQPCIASDSQSFQISVIPSFFRGPKCNWRSALRCGGSRLTSPEARVRGSELSRKRLRHAQCGTLGPPFALYEGQKASKRGRSRNEGIPEGYQARPSSSCAHPMVCVLAYVLLRVLIVLLYLQKCENDWGHAFR